MFHDPLRLPIRGTYVGARPRRGIENYIIDGAGVASAPFFSGQGRGGYLWIIDGTHCLGPSVWLNEERTRRFKIEGASKNNSSEDAAAMYNDPGNEAIEAYDTAIHPSTKEDPRKCRRSASPVKTTDTWCAMSGVCIDAPERAPRRMRFRRRMRRAKQKKRKKKKKKRKKRAGKESWDPARGDIACPRYFRFARSLTRTQFISLEGNGAPLWKGRSSPSRRT